MQNDTLLSPLKDARVRAVIERLVEARRIPSSGSPSDHPEVSRDPFDYAEYGFSIWPDQGDLLYLLCRGMRATRVVDFATSIGMSAVYFAAAMRDNGGGIVIGSELVPEKVKTARRNLADAGLAAYADIREGDARQTLSDAGGPVDFALIDGWPQWPGAIACARGYRNPGSSDANGKLCDERQRGARLSAIRARPCQWLYLCDPTA
jgi:predicted O-methyltransferase YrrM